MIVLARPRNPLQLRIMMHLLSVTTLLVLPLISAQGQIYVSGSAPCNKAAPQAKVKCTAWTKCDMVSHYIVVRSWVESFVGCPGWIVWNRAQAASTRILLGNEGSTLNTLQSPTGQTLEFKLFTHTCVGVPFRRTITSNPCPGAPGASLTNDDFSLAVSPSTQFACQALGMFWSHANQACFEQESDQDGCDMIGGFWNSLFGFCSESPDPSGGPELCQSLGWFWNFSTNQCNPEPQTCSGHCAPYYPLESGACEYSIDYCAFQWGCGFGFTDGGAGCCCLPTPILIDVAGNGFSLSNAYDGVHFDMGGDGRREPVAWTTAGTDDAWLVLDRNGNGLVDSAKEMFGNFTDQPPETRRRNGFAALAEFDKANQGGNNDGQISSEDSVFANLRLWQDVNHDGISQGNELTTLSSVGIARVDLKYQESKKADEHGNQFSFRAKVSDVHGTQVGRWAWDVTLTVNPPPRP